jgi:O-antigen/teichoic acid export membrane protein
MVLAFAAAQCFMVLNTSMAALLQAQGHVGGLSITSVAGKLLWGAGILICMILGFGLVAVPLTLLGSEILKSAALLSLTRKHLKLRFQFDLRATKTVIVKSLPFYLNTVAFTAYSTLGVSLLTFQVNRDEEVGWYGAATNLAGLALLMTPLIGWVLMPLYSKAAARSDQELTAALRRTLELVLTLAVPISLMLSVGADVWIPAMFGREFVPATLSLRLLAPMFVLTYMASVCGIGLIMLDRGWRVTLISLGSLVLNTLLNLVLIRPGLSLLGPGGGGAGCALAQILTEAAAAGAMVTSLGGRAFDRRSATTLCKSLAACGAVVLLDRLVGALGPARLALDLAAYLALATWMGAIPVRQILQLTRSALSRHEASALPS